MSGPGRVPRVLPWLALLPAGVILAEVAVRFGLAPGNRSAVMLLVWLPAVLRGMTWLYRTMIDGMIEDAGRRRRRDRDGR